MTTTAADAGPPGRTPEPAHGLARDLGRALEAALAALDARRDATRDALAALVRIPGVSAEGYPPEALETSAEAVARFLTDCGLEHVEVVPHPGAPPAVVADWCHAEGAPTLLVYGHHDVQPPGDLARWTTPPWEPVERDGRLYGRGAVDDKAGVVSHVAAIAAWLKGPGRLPVNVKLIIEGEEEVGSPHLADFLARHRERLAADCLVLTDTCNLETGIPSLTVSLRGLLMADVEVTALDGPLHSGIWGGPVPDPVQALAKLLARLSDDRGRLAVPGIAADPVPDAAYAGLPFDAGRYRAQGGLADGVDLLTQGAAETYRSNWDAPAVAVSAVEAGSFATASNQILPRARARLGVRLAPDQEPEACMKALVRFLTADPPFGCRVTVTPKGTGGGWRTRPEGPYFAAAGRALKAGYGTDAVHIGCGGSIPFVEPFARTMGDVPALLLGVEDPACRAHGEDESLSLADFHKACRAAVHLYAEVAAVGADPRADPRPEGTP
jgi:acetylornithine deacetylase/succinyl-diaminopimelate desuccinylase-like protein